MKKLFWSAGCMAVLAACAVGRKSQITAHIEGWGNDTIVVAWWDAASDDLKTDSVAAHNGRFAYNAPADSIMQFEFFRERDLHPRQGMGLLPDSRKIEVCLLPGDRVRVKGRARADKVVEYSATGSELMDDLSAMRQRALPILLLRDSNEFKIEAAMEHGGISEQEEEALWERRRGFNAQTRSLKGDFVRAHPNRQASALFVLSQVRDSIPAMYALLGEQVRSGALKPLLDRELREQEFYEIYKKSSQKEFTGELAPDFTLTDINGNNFTLSEFNAQDKFIVLDFWGSWCGPCLMGLPAMKSYHNKYRQLEFVSIACNDKPEQWRAAVAEHGMEWINVLDDDSSPANNVAARYGVAAYPTKIILSPDKKVLFRFSGEGRDFYDKLDELLR